MFGSKFTTTIALLCSIVYAHERCGGHTAADVQNTTENAYPTMEDAYATPTLTTPAVPTPAVPTPAVPTPAVPTPAASTSAVHTPAVHTPSPELNTAAPMVAQKLPQGGSIEMEWLYLLEQSNIARAHHGVPPLTWDQNLANQVQQGANQCPGYTHIDSGNSWQNLASGAPCDGTKDNKCMVKKRSEAWRWYENEEHLWDYQYKTCTQSWEKCGHFVIMIAPEQKTMGCAKSSCGGRTFFGRTFHSDDNVWCNYNGLKSKNPVIPPPIGTKQELEAKLQNHYQQFVNTHY